MKEEIAKTLKSADTEDWLDYHVVRPFSYYWAKFFAKLGVSPNSVTVMSMVIGAASCLFFVHGSYHYEALSGLILNIVGLLLLFLADIFDCADGQLARMTGKKSPLGRILDGLAGFTWYVPIYAALVYRFYLHHDIEFAWLGIADTQSNVLIATAVVFVLALLSGVCGIAPQQRLADYYIQAHLFFLKGEAGSELDNSVQQRAKYEAMGPETPWYERLFQRNYIDYTRLQEKRTPQFQRLLAVMRAAAAKPDADLARHRQEFVSRSKPILTYNGMLTFNFRTSYFLVFCLLDVPVLTFLFEIVCMSLLALYVNRRHERMCRNLANTIALEK